MYQVALIAEAKNKYSSVIKSDTPKQVDFD